jgi:hypothetical protein
VIRGRPLRVVYVMPKRLPFFIALMLGYELPIRPGLVL